MKTNVYVDGFNLYYGCLKNSPHKWLDINALCGLELPKNKINRIRYFTAMVSGRASDPDEPVRQQTYVRALGTIPHLEVHYGHFLSSKPRMRLARPIPGLPDSTGVATMSQDEQDAYVKHGLPDMAQVHKTEEKGSDVNIASYLLFDAFKRDCDVAIVISNDSDLATPIYMARVDFGVRVVCLMPCSGKRRPSMELKKAASAHQVIQQTHLANSQFSAILIDAKGKFSKPPAW